MTGFEDLIEDLKTENLLEETIIESSREQQRLSESESAPQTVLKVSAEPSDFAIVSEQNSPRVKTDDCGATESDFPADQVFDEKLEVAASITQNAFYRRRATEEVSSLQMVERIFMAVEREQVKISPKPYDDIAVSKALHEFLQVSKNPNSPENAHAEFKLMQETESWYSALSYRDQQILPAHLRRYCENAKPALSSQALAALARFYRNAAHTEATRSKFDMILSRLFSSEREDDRRMLLFEHDELVKHVSELYADWSSVSLHGAEDESELLIAALKFEDFLNEARNAAGFEDLVKSDFFNRLRAFKETVGEAFYEPQIVAATIRCNVEVGNIYVELLNREKAKHSAETLEEKYGHLLDQTISEATSKTFQLVRLLQNKKGEAEDLADQPKIKVETLTEKSAPAKKSSRSGGGLFQGVFEINKWLLAATVLTILFAAGLYLWVEMNTPAPNQNDVKTLNVEGLYFQEHIKVAKISNDTLIGIVNPSYLNEKPEKRNEILRNLLAIGKEKGYSSVKMMSNEGKSLGFASAASDNRNEAGNR